MEKILFLALIAMILVSGCTSTQAPDGDNKAVGGEKIVYEKDGKLVVPDQILPDNMKPGLQWLMENTPEDSVVMSWWDYGHAIRSYAKREPVVDSPSREALTTTVSKYLGKDPAEIECDTCVDNEMLREIAELFLTENASRAAELMEKYNAQYLYVHVEDEEKSFAMNIILGEEEIPENYLLGRFLAEETVEGFSLMYEDAVCRIYRFSA